MRFTKFLSAFFLFVVPIIFWGCETNPSNPDQNDHPVNQNGRLLVVEEDSAVVNGRIFLSFSVDASLYDSAESKTALRGFDDWNSGYPGKHYFDKHSNQWVFCLEAKPGVYKFNFWGSKGWVKPSLLNEKYSNSKPDSSYWFPMLGDFGIKITDDFKIERPSKAEMFRLGQPASGQTPITVDTTHQIIIYRWERISDTLLDTIYLSASKGTIVLLGDSVVYKRNPSLSSFGYDTVKIAGPGNISGGVINYDAIVKWTSSVQVTNAKGEKGFKCNLTFDSDPEIIHLVANGHPFVIGLPSWDGPNNLGTKTDGRYPYTTGFMTPGRHNFGAGGDYQNSWINSAVLAKSVWGFKTKDGWILQGVLTKDGRFLPGSLVDTIQVAPVYDTVFVKDTVVERDTITLPGKIVIDSIVKIITITRTDTIFHSDTTCDTIAKFFAGDLVKVGQAIAVAGGFNFQLYFADPLVTVVSNGRPFVMGLPDWSRAPSLGAKRPDMYYHFSVTLKTGSTYTFAVGGDSARSWANSSVLNGTVWGYKTSLGWIMRGTVTKDGRFIPTSLVVPADTVKIHDTTIVRDTTVRTDTIIRQGQTLYIYDSIIIVKTRVDTLLRTDTLNHSDTIRIADLGIATFNIAGLSSDTAWSDTALRLKGIASRDSSYRTLYIHTVMTIGAKHDTSYARDTTSTTRLVPLGRDTFDLVLLFVSATPGTGDTVNVNFKLTAKVFSDAGETVANALGLKPEAWSEKTPSVSKSDGYFNFSVKMVKGAKYRPNFTGSGTAWAQQAILRLSKYVFVEGANTDLAISLNADATGFIYAPPAAP